MRDFKGLKVWEKSHQVTLEVYKATAGFPREEVYGLTSQIRRAAASIPANIAEGCGRQGVSELVRFLNIAMGSASELEYHLLLAHGLGFFSYDNHALLAGQLAEVKRMLATYIQKANTDQRNQRPEVSSQRTEIRNQDHVVSKSDF